MGKYDGVVGIAKRTMVLFLIIDKSGSMKGSKIGAVNVAVKEVIPEIQQIAKRGADAEIKIAVLTFSSGAQWMYPSPIEVKDFKWTNINADGVTDMGHAFKMLNEKLSRKGGFMIEAAGSYAPALFLLSDGQPTDNYQLALNELKNNNWFKYSLKAAVAIGDDADQAMLAEFTGNPESVLLVHTPEALKKVIRFVTVKTTEIGSKSGQVPVDGQDQIKQDIFKDQIVDFNDTLVDTATDNWH